MNTFKERFYRHWSKDEDGLTSFTVNLEETNIFVRLGAHTQTTITFLEKEALSIIKKNRRTLKKFIKEDPLFYKTLTPYPLKKPIPPIIEEMILVSQKVNVGPMATVAGIIAEYLGKELLNYTNEVMVENGGDIFMKISKKRVIGIYAGSSPFSQKIALEISPQDTPLGICTSAGTVGHSLSFGKADAAVVLSRSTSLADAAATAVGNIVKEESDIEAALKFAREIEDLKGVVIIKDNKMGLWGDLKLCRI